MIAGICAISAVLGVLLYLFGQTRWDVFVLIGLFGVTALPFYGLSVAHANDRIPRESFVEASATLLMVNALSSCFGPTLAAVVMDHFGTASLFLYTAAIHTAMTIFIVWRLSTRDALIGETRDKYEMVPQQGSPASLELDPRGAGREAGRLMLADRRRVAQDHGLGEGHEHQRHHEDGAHDQEHVAKR